MLLLFFGMGIIPLEVVCLFLSQSPFLHENYQLVMIAILYWVLLVLFLKMSFNSTKIKFKLLLILHCVSCMATNKTVKTLYIQILSLNISKSICMDIFLNCNFPSQLIVATYISITYFLIYTCILLWCYGWYVLFGWFLYWWKIV